MRTLSSSLRKQLEISVLAARRGAEAASRAAIEGLGVFADRRPEHLNAAQATLRNGLRAKWRQLGNDRGLLVAECAYEQWHLLLFARFLADNGLLLHPRFRAPVTLAECEELALELGEPDAWSVAAGFAAEILPGIFRLDDPCVRLRLAPEGRFTLEQILDAIPEETFLADDALGWVYQFWQKDKKDEVNGSERKIGGADLGPVTQLFTENYMVRFLLENSLGAWWAARHPDSPLVKEFDYLRLGEDGKPATGAFEDWPDRAAEVTVMDPCCGSGHFLVEALAMLWRMRAEEDGLAPVEAQDAVLRDNLFGLELDPRCVQIAMFNVALQAWKAGGRWRQLPVPNIVCSGIRVKAPVEEWKALAGGDYRLENALVRLHVLFRDADTLGSLIDPKRVAEISDPTGAQTSLDDVEWDLIAPVIEAASTRDDDPALPAMGGGALALARAAVLLSRRYDLVVTNVPYLLRRRQDPVLQKFIDTNLVEGRADLGNAFFERSLSLVHSRGVVGVVTQQSWLNLATYQAFRRMLLTRARLASMAILGEGAFESVAAAGAFPVLTIVELQGPPLDQGFPVYDVSSERPAGAKAAALVTTSPQCLIQRKQLENPSTRIELGHSAEVSRLSRYAGSYQGTTTGDNARWTRFFWEVRDFGQWVRFQGTVEATVPYGGRQAVLWWGDDGRCYERNAGSRLQGQAAWGKKGVAVSQMRDLEASIYTGDVFDMNMAAVVPYFQDNLAALWAFCSSSEYHDAVRRLDRSIKVTNRTLAQVPFDIDRWRKIAEQAGALPEPWSDDPTQWLFEGRPEESTAPLQVGVARLVGYRWPEQSKVDDLDAFADTDGIVCLPAVAGEPPAADRVQRLLAAAFGESWNPGKGRELIAQAGGNKDLADWLRDDFFRQHCLLFGNRPFVWHIWDGQRYGFSALVNCHRLDRKRLEKLTYTYLGQDWVERQRAEVHDGLAGAAARLAAALGLQQKLEAILEGAAPLDIYVRWKELHEQPIGWEPDVNDGVRLNIRPFVQAGVLRAPFNIHWRKDRGKNPDGTERFNDIHATLAKKLEARQMAGRL